MSGTTRVRLLCFAHAGGSAQLSYRRWADSLGPVAQVCPVELPGRGRRAADPLLTDLDALLEDALAMVRPLTDEPYALFGHSFGAVLAFEVARRLTGEPPGSGPVALFVSGRRPPDQAARYGFHELADAELISVLDTLGGIPAPLLAVPAVLAGVLPAVRADLAVSEGYHRGPAAELTCPITALTGDADPLVNPRDIAGWQQFTTGPFEAKVMSGGHHYLADQEAVTGLISCKLRRWQGHSPSPSSERR